jgi:hypothetical protein
VQVIEQLKSYAVLRIYAFLTSLLLSLSILLSLLAAMGNILIQTIASMTIILGTILEILQILIVIQLTNRDEKAGWVLHRFAYMTLVVMILSFLSMVGGTFLSSFFIFGRDVMTIAVIGYIMQASFGICLSSITYHFLQIEDVWLKRFAVAS